MDNRFAPTALETARERIAALFDGYCEATGVPITILSEIVSDDRAFVSRYKRSSISFATYDRVAGRFSAIWPADLDWPDGIPRPAPEEPPADLRAELRHRLAKAAQAAQPALPKLPADAAWPNDIPAPGQAQPARTEA